MSMLCNHPNIIEFTGYSDTPDFCIVMKMCSYSLHQLIHSSSELEVRVVLKLAKEVAAGMAFIHQNEILHLDLKPGNILIDEYGDDPDKMTAKITDFGFATPIEGSSELDREVSGLKRARIVGMTTEYAAPEVRYLL